MDTLDPGLFPNISTRLKGDWEWNSPLQGDFTGQTLTCGCPKTEELPA